MAPEAQGSNHPGNGRYAHGGRNKYDLRDQRASNPASRKPNDGPPEAGLARSSVHDIVGHDREMRVDEDEQQDRRDAIDHR